MLINFNEKRENLMCELSIVMPCLNESETLEICIKKAQTFLQKNNIKGEVIIADNGSSDGSIEIAKQHGARVINVKEKGYGCALMGGIQAAQGRYVIMGDADDSYDFAALENYVKQLREGYDLVMGNRFKGGIKPNAMPFLHRYLGNPVLSWIGRLFFKSSIGDFHCGLRGFKREAILGLDLRTTGMEFASEMIVKAALHNLKIAEVPTVLYPDGRTRPPHLRTWRDGWRHLKFLLMFSPRWLFFYPGLSLIFMGIIGMLLILPAPFSIGQITLDIHSLLLAGIAVILGVQAVSFAIILKQLSLNLGISPSRKSLLTTELLNITLPLEWLLVLSLFLISLGIIGISFSIYTWSLTHFGSVSIGYMMRILIPATTSLTVGFQIAMTGFLRDIINIHRVDKIKS